MATEPPVIQAIDPNHWKATMKVLVIYQNPEYKQHQDLQVTIEFAKASAGTGVRGYNIVSLQSIITKPPCQCPIDLSPGLPANVGSVKQ